MERADDRRAEMSRAVHAVDEPFDDRAGNELEVADTCEDDGVDESRPAQCPGLNFISASSDSVTNCLSSSQEIKRPGDQEEFFLKKLLLCGR